METEEVDTSEDELIPEEGTRPETTGLYCFLQDTRVCGASCMAYVTYPKASSSSELGGQQQHCALLSGVERVGRNVTVLASIQANTAKRAQVEAADRRRDQQLIPRDPAVQAEKSPFGGGRNAS